NQLGTARRGEQRGAVVAREAATLQRDDRHALPERFRDRVAAAIRPGIEADVDLVVAAQDRRTIGAAEDAEPFRRNAKAPEAVLQEVAGVCPGKGGLSDEEQR